MLSGASPAVRYPPHVTTQRLLGIDYGERRIGIAVADGTLAVPVKIIEHESRAADLDHVADAVREQSAAAVIVGLPLLPSGDDSEQTRRCRRFGEALARRIDVPVLFQDELLTSVDAAASVRELVGSRGTRWSASTSTRPTSRSCGRSRSSPAARAGTPRSPAS